jgi:nitroimidazol reductase NimA-like FMN-containing flavoprotein (pyridoxamine 5'-phosphate oxidase superfamily)
MDNCVEVDALSRAECLYLLSKATVGRIGLSRGALPTVIPVNYCLRDNRIFVLADSRDPLAAMLNGQVVAFQVDDIAAVCASGHTVVVTGRAAVVTNSGDLNDGHAICIGTELMSGRRLG